jgi:hypothetical protein
MLHELVFVRGGYQRHVVQEETHRYSFLCGQHRASLVAGPSPTLSESVKVPGAVHPEMRMQACSVVETGEQVLSDAVHAQHGEPGQIMLGQPWMAEFPMSQALPAQRSRQTLGRQVHGAAFGHGYLAADGDLSEFQIGDVRRGVGVVAADMARACWWHEGHILTGAG